MSTGGRKRRPGSAEPVHAAHPPVKGDTAGLAFQGAHLNFQVQGLRGPKYGLPLSDPFAHWEESQGLVRRWGPLGTARVH